MTADERGPYGLDPELERIYRRGYELRFRRKVSRAISSVMAVALMASGGLTHFVIDEDFDRKVLAAMASGDEDSLAKLPESYFKVGTAEIKNWYPVISAMNAAGLKYHQIDYVPCYRSPAGTGTANGFYWWEVQER